jgi:hypothetical protein
VERTPGDTYGVWRKPEMDRIASFPDADDGLELAEARYSDLMDV